MAGLQLASFRGLYQMFGIGPISLKQQSLCLDTVKTLISYVEIFLDVKVSNLVKEIIGILGLLCVRQPKTL